MDLSSRVGFVKETAVAVVAAARGYPDSPEKGDVIEGLKVLPPQCFYAGVAKRFGKWVTHGGRVLATVGMGNDLNEARRDAYEKLRSISFKGMQYRTDIGLGTQA
jgi:phosphoribosylamine--glycine ligase